KLILNLVDAPKSIFFDKGLIDLALDFIDEELNGGKKVLIVCNRGESRSASLSLLYLIKHNLIKGDTLEDVEAEFMKLYPKYNPGTGMREFVKENFEEYRK
ncbi:MAG TPA: dual specificity protein phosphatase family protein, partial [Epulopiscium sp.]|nr:dual specificity protein phosphatase family protein [Candidatus Epulonipiscium sp.]